jgi:hypothetical protein
MKYTFQHPANAMRLSVRTVDLSRRVAFDRQRILRPSSSSNTTNNNNNSSAAATMSAIPDELFSSSSVSNIVSSHALRRMVEEMDRVRNIRRGGGSTGGGEDGSSIHNNNNNHGNPCRISPSPNHMAILEFMHGLTSMTSSVARPRVVRQLRWNVACSEDADPWFDGTYYDDNNKNNINDDDDDDDLEEVDDDIGSNRRRSKKSNGSINNSGAMMRNLSLDETKPGLVAAAAPRASAAPVAAAMPRRKRPSHGRNDGRYIPIDALASVRSSIPNHSPILTNAKRRLPTRSDVGFANPSPEEISSKMDEVRKEAEWEEASPRIVLLASGFMLFDEKKNGPVEDEKKNDDDMVDRVHPSCKGDVLLWAGGAIPGVPFAGRDLVKLYQRAMIGANGDSSKSARIDIDQHHAKNPRTYSVFAPPVDAVFSSSQLWRPRPFVDRPPGHIYFLACPLDIQLDDGDAEPYFCTMALYSLPPKQQQTKISTSTPSTSAATSAESVFRGKISEDFFFPAGNWNSIEGVRDGREEEDGCRQSDNHDDEEPSQQSWRRRKRRAIMSYDPLDVSFDDLHLVIQVFRAIGRGRTPSVDRTNGSNINKRGLFAGKLLSSKAKSRQKDQSTVEYMKQSTRESFEEVGAQHLVPVCVGVAPVFRTQNISEQKLENTALYSLPDASLSTEDFVKLLTSISITSSLPKANTTSNICGSADVFTSYLGR